MKQSIIQHYIDGVGNAEDLPQEKATEILMAWITDPALSGESISLNLEQTFRLRDLIIYLTEREIDATHLE